MPTLAAVTGAPADAANGVLPEDSGFLHRTWQFEDGLPHNVVRSVLQTRDGYLWVGTANGLARFDGLHFTVFDPENTPELKSPQIRRLCETRDGALWIATDEGLTRLKDGQFAHFSTADGLAGNLVRELYEMRDGALWVGTITGLSIFSEGAFRNPEQEAFTKVIRAIGQDQHDGVWVADERNLLLLREGKLMSFGGDDAGRPTPVHMFRTVHVDREGALWAGSMHGLVRYKEDVFKLYDRSDGLAGHVVNTIYEDSRGRLWVGSFGGLNRFEGGRLVSELDAQGHAYDVVFDVTEDREGNIWIGSKDGLSQLRPRVFNTITNKDGLGHNNVMSIVEDHSGALWVSSWGGGVDRMESGKVTLSLTREGTVGAQPVPIMHSDFVLALHQTRDQAIWFGLDYDGGLYRFKDDVLTRYGDGEGLSPSGVRVIYEDRHDNLWVGMAPALHLFKDGRFVRFTTEDGLPANLVRVIQEDKEGNLWLGTEQGLVLYQEGHFTTFTTDDGLSSDFIMALHPDEEGNLWIGTRGGGLVRYRDGVFSTYTTRQGLFQDEVMSIVGDDFGYLWMSCGFGVFRVSKEELDRLDRGELSRVTSHSYGRNEGILSIQGNASAQPAGAKTKDGRIWFATTKGMVVVDPRTVLADGRQPPPVHIERVVLGTNTVDPTKMVPSRARQMEFHFSSLSLSVPEKNRFRFKLEGFDHKWVEAGSRRVAYYTNLRPGTYTFRVVGSNNQGLWNESGDSITFSISPYFYETPWFFLSCAFVGGISLLGTYKLRLRHLRRRETLLKEMVDQRTQTLKTEIAERKRAQAEVEKIHRQLLDASHQAGMAEVASGVLHNVGNVLNSVNVSANLVSDSIRRTRTVNLQKAAALLEENADRLPDFLKNDEKGKQLPGYLISLADHLAQEQVNILKELDGLCKNVDHIKDIVAMQQNYANVFGVVETLPVSDLVEDALRMNMSALTRHRVEVLRDYTSAPVVSVDKHRVLQILVNLIRNAKYACKESGRDNRKIVLRIALSSPANVQISVADNGVGIPAESLNRIFSHGFTTREEGHGLGLHSAALAAREIGGSLSVSSDGLGHGSTFSLEIPLQPKSLAKNEPHL